MVLHNVPVFLEKLVFYNNFLFVPSKTECYNHVRFLDRYNDTHLYTCGTHAFRPRCAYIVRCLLLSFCPSYCKGIIIVNVLSSVIIYLPVFVRMWHASPLCVLRRERRNVLMTLQRATLDL